MNFQFSKPKLVKNLTVASLLFLVFIIPFLSMQNFSPASDEVTHIPSGYSYLKTREIKLNPQHPPFIKILSAVPLLFLDVKFNSDDPNFVGPAVREWQFGKDFLAENDINRILFWARLPIVLLSVLLGWYVFRWGRDLFGYQGGLAGLFAYAFMPNIIAHSQLVTTDLGVTAFVFISLYYFWRLLNSDLKNKKNLVMTGIFLGLALGSKFSAVFLLPILLILMIVYFVQKPGSVLEKINSTLKVLLPIFFIAYFIVWALYFFSSDPMFYYKGLKTVYADRNTNYLYYLNGSFSPTAWRSYFVWAFIIKTPVPFLVILFAAFVYFRKQNLNFLNNLFILLPSALFLFMASWKAHNIGIRYILPIYPFLILYVGGFIEIFRYFDISTFRYFKTKIKIAPILILVLTGWYVFSTVSTYPNHLAYFNELIGGSKNGYKYLDDSNIEWGQDLKRLAVYQKENPDLKVMYSWSAFIDAKRFYGIKNIVPLQLSERWWDDPSGKYAVNTHALIRFKLASQKYGEEKLNWPELYEPIDKIGQSFFIYEF